ncbi:MAG TPA: acetyl-CoA carboxylase biotin carboxylase subunit [candidate division Zixibacteria bacterium]|nr:acetyl-CoA carboxylase biotin carboxylase subunit [candidate division Zixibacteria bacterium]
MEKLFKKILVANRSEIAIRVINACRTLGIPSVAVYSDADVNSRHRLTADESVHIGASPPRESYLDIDKLIAAAKETGADAIHPGYGFLAENPVFARHCAEEGLTFIGPSPEAIELLGNKVASRVKMADAGVPLIPGMKGSETDPAVYKKVADEAGYPVMIKAAAGGGGKGMRIVRNAEELVPALEAAQREALNAFNDDTVYLEKYIVNPRHIEFQVLADQHGHTMHVFERECSIQRRHQKIIEETPSVAVSDELRARMGADAVKVAQAADYTNAGTVEFLLDESGRYYFLEMNTRIQVEHPITEMVTGVDLVVEQIRIAAGLPLSEQFMNLTQRGHAIECRIYAEDGDNNFMPSTGKIHHYSEPVGPGIRVDSGIQAGQEVTIDYDPIMAKLIVHAPSREIAIEKMIGALNDYKILGVKTSKRFMIEAMMHPEFAAGRTYTDFIEKNMADRDVDYSPFRELAAAAASAATVLSVRKAIVAPGGETTVPSPWQSLGAWQIGETIHE